MGSRKKYSKELKHEVVRQLSTKSQAELCREYDISHQLLYRWKCDYEANPKEAFRGNGHIWKLEAKLAESERIIGRLYAENALLKKSIDCLSKLKEEQQKKKQSTKW